VQTVVSIFQITLSLILLNVWLLRFNQSTAYRGGGASSMRLEFAAYKLPAWSLYVVGALKVGAALCLPGFGFVLLFFRQPSSFAC